MVEQSSKSSPTLRERLQTWVAEKYQHKSQNNPVPEKTKEARTQANLKAIDPDIVRPVSIDPEITDEVYAEALRALTDRAFCQTERYSIQQGRAERTGAQQTILDFERKLISRTRKMGVPLFTHCCVRGSEDQNRLFKEGRSKARAGESPHNYGAAVDIIHGTKGWNLTRKQWAILGHIGKEVAATSGISIVWGGDWEFFDPAHWEMTEWRKIRALYADGEDWDGRQ